MKKKQMIGKNDLMFFCSNPTLQKMQFVFRTGKISAIRTIAVRETTVSRTAIVLIAGDPIDCPSKTALVHHDTIVLSDLREALKWASDA